MQRDPAFRDQPLVVVLAGPDHYAADGDLAAEGTALRVGGSMGVVRVVVRTSEGDDERLVAEGRVTLHIDRG